MKLCLFGAGAVGGHLAARLAAAGAEVSVVARGAHLEAMRARGIRLQSGEETIHGKVRAAASPAELGAQDFVLVTLKANALGAFAAACAPLLGRDTAVVFVQNGIPWWYPGAPASLDPGGALARALAPERVMAGVVYSANDVIEPGVVMNHTPGRNLFVIGETTPQDSPRAARLRALLERSGVAAPAAGDIRASIWSKLTLNLGTSTLCTLTGLDVGALRADERLGRLAAGLGEEGRRIAQALGVDVGKAPQRPGGGHSSGLIRHKPSMLQDYERGRPMEVEAQLMAPLALAREAGVAAPLLELGAALVAQQAAAKGLYASGR